MFLSEELDRLNKVIDAPSKLLGTRHRVLFRSSLDALIQALLSSEPVKVFVAAKMQQMVDREAGKNSQGWSASDIHVSDEHAIYAEAVVEMGRAENIRYSSPKAM